MKMLGRRAHEAVQECRYGCCMRRGFRTRKGRLLIKRSVKRSERQTWKRNAA